MKIPNSTPQPKRVKTLNQWTTKLALCLGLASLAAPALAAGNDTWAGDTDGYFGTSANWLFSSGSGPVAAGDSLIFAAAGASGALVTNNLATGTSLAAITFNGPGAFTLSGNPIILAGNIANNSTALQTISFPITNTAARTVTTTAGGGNIVLNGGMVGTGGSITKAATAGTLTLGGVNTYTAGTTVNGGVLTFSANNSLPTNGTLTLNNIGTVVDLAGTSQSIGQLTMGTELTGGSSVILTNSAATVSTITLNESANDYSFRSGTIVGPVKFVLIGSGIGSNLRGEANALQFGTNNSPGSPCSTFNTFTGGTRVQGASGTIGTANLLATGGVSDPNGASIRCNGPTNQLGTGPIILDNGSFWQAQCRFYAFPISNSVSVTANGGILTMEGNANFYGPISGPGFLCLDYGFTSGSGANFWGDLSGFTGTLAIDSTYVGNVNIDGVATNLSNATVEFYGSGALAPALQWNDITSGPTIGIAELISGAASGNTANAAGKLSCAVATNVTFQVDDNTANTPVFAGIIQNGSGSVSLVKVGGNTQTLTTAATYTGTTVISNGTLAVAGLASTNVTVSAPGVLVAAGTIAGPVTLGAGSASINMINNTPSSLSVGDGTTGLNLANGNVLGFDVGATTDTIAVNGSFSQSGTATILINQASGFAAGSYALITGASGILASHFTMGTSIPGYTLTLSNPDSATLQLTVTLSGAASAFWIGDVSSVWNAHSGGNYNWDTDQSSGINLGNIPTAPTDVTFAANGAANFNTTLGANTSIHSLTLNTPNVVTIGGANTLTLNGGIAVNTGAGSDTISTKALVLAVDQLWNITDSGNELTISAPVSGAHAVTVAGAGSVLLSGVNTYTGGTLVSGSATLILGNATNTLADTGAVNVDTGTLIIGTNNDTVGAVSLTNGIITGTSGKLTASSFYAESGTLAANLGGPGGLLKETGGTLLLSGTNSYAGVTLIDGGLVQLGSSTALGTGNASVSSGAALELNGQHTTNVTGVSGTGVSGNGALVNSSTNLAVVDSAISASSATPFAIDAEGDIILQRAFSLSGAFTVTKNGPGTLTLGDTNAAGHNNLMAIVANEGTVVLNMPGYLALDRTPITFNNDTVLRLAGTGGNQITDDQEVDLNDTSVFDLNGRSEAIGYLNTAIGTVVSNSAAGTVSTLTVGGGYGSGGTGSVVGTIIDGAGQVALIMAGTNELTLYGNDTYSGNTTITNGTLGLNDSSSGGTISNTAVINIAGGATLDAAGRADQTLTLNKGQTLTGAGSINGNLVTAPGSIVNPGTGVGELLVTNNIALDGELLLELNRADSPNADQLVSVLGTITYGGTLLVTNTGAALQAGDKFQLFPAAVTAFAGVTLATTDATGYTYTWINNVAANGSVSVLTVTAPINANPPVVQVSVSGNTLSLGWPTNQGWILQTNSVSLTQSNQWFAYPGSASVTNVNLPIIPGKTNVFFRMVHP
jgi:autotransporter-associated beta strand protein